MTPAPARREAPAPGYACGTCGEWLELPPYVLHHWHTTVFHHCRTCYALHELTRGAAVLKFKGKVRK